MLTTNVDPNIVYALNANTGVHPPHHTAVYRSDDAGKNWRATFYPDPRFKICNAEPDFNTVSDGQFYQQPALGAAIDAANPDHLMWVSDWVYYTTDGGKTWKCGHARRAGGSGKEAAWLCNGLVVTTTWNYYIDPFEPNRHYIAYTDIGFARSLDAGKTWIWWAQGQGPLAQHLLRTGLRPADARQDLGALLRRARHPQRQHHPRRSPCGPRRAASA